MRLYWFLSTYDLIQDMPKRYFWDNSNYSKVVVIDSETIEESFKKFYKSKEFNDFANATKNVYWYYYDENDCLSAYGMPYYLENEL